MKKSKKLKIIIPLVLVVCICIGLASPSIYDVFTKIDFGEIVLEGIPEKADDAVRVMSFNVRCASDPEGSIYNRSQLVNAVLEQYAPDSFGVQEATPKWIRLIDKALGDKYEKVGKARDLFGPYTEYSSVYYLKDKYELIDSGTIWLSETPEKAYSRSFDSSRNRVMTWATLKNKETGEVYTHMNTHLDHQLESTRVEQTKVLLSYLDEFEKLGPVVCTGDFNTSEERETYPLIVDVLDDSRTVAETTDSGATYHKYGQKPEDNPPIDFIFVTKGTKVDTYKVADYVIQGMYPSDHHAVCADVVF